MYMYMYVTHETCCCRTTSKNIVSFGLRETLRVVRLMREPDINIRLPCSRSTTHRTRRGTLLNLSLFLTAYKYNTVT